MTLLFLLLRTYMSVDKVQHITPAVLLQGFQE